MQAHRGGRDRRPENTLAAFAWAMDLGVTTLEADLAVTADGIVVISHDPYLSAKLVRDSAGEYVVEEPPLFIKDLTLSELQTYDVGQLNPRDSYANNWRGLRIRRSDSISRSRPIPQILSTRSVTGSLRDSSWRPLIGTA